ncbi:hypothetical protein BJX76DRAFT_361668 [Aspergillus varians]
MRGCRTVQCLIAKAGNELSLEVTDWRPEADDFDFEQTSQYFLSGLCDSMTSDMFSAWVSPARHGVAVIEGPRDPRKRLGRVDVDRLADWFDASCDYYPHMDADVEWITGGGDVYSDYKPNEEWQVANPFFVPRLHELLDKATNTDTEGQSMPKDPSANSPKNSETCSYPTSAQSTSSPSFLHLPNALWKRLLHEDIP